MRFKKHARRAVPALVTATGLAMAIAAAPIETTSAGARMWASSLSAAERQRYWQVDRLQALPIEYRRALFASEPSAERRAQFWRDVVVRYRQTHVLTPEGERLLNRAELSLTAGLFSSRRDKERTKAVNQTRAEISAVLGPAAAEEIFVYGGGQGDPSSLPMSERIRYTVRAHRPTQLVAVANFIAPELLAYTCNCTNDSECYSHTRCGYSPFSCDQTSWGCGSYWAESCTSLCSYAGLS